jgi:hypothetical protein
MPPSIATAAARLVGTRSSPALVNGERKLFPDVATAFSAARHPEVIVTSGHL